MEKENRNRNSESFFFFRSPSCFFFQEEFFLGLILMRHSPNFLFRAHSVGNFMIERCLTRVFHHRPSPPPTPNPPQTTQTPQQYPKLPKSPSYNPPPPPTNPHHTPIPTNYTTKTPQNCYFQIFCARRGSRRGERGGAERR